MTQKISTYSDFLENKKFILWRLTKQPQLNAYWFIFIKENPELKEEFEKAVVVFDSIKINEKVFSGVDLLYRRVLESISLEQTRIKRKKLIYYFSSAAAVVLLLMTTTFYYFYQQYTQNDLLTAKEEVVGEFHLGEEIQLIVDGETINLKQNEKVELSQTGEATIGNDSVKSKKTLVLAENKTNRLVVPYGMRTFLALSDGTKIWLNSGTEIEFPAVFKSSVREINVCGEIFIDVAKQDKQFIIRTPNSQIQVFGTSFNVNAYKDEKQETVVLVEGSVQVKSIKGNNPHLLSPSQMAEIEDGNIKIKTVDTSEYVSWKNGHMILQKEPLLNVLKKIGRYYNVEFRYAENLAITGKTCSGKLFLSEDVNEVLKTLTYLTFLNYEQLSKNVIYIKKQ